VKLHASAGDNPAGRRSLDGADASACVRTTPTGLAGEFVFTLPEGEKKTFRLNFGWMDQGPPREQPKPSVALVGATMAWRNSARSRLGGRRATVVGQTPEKNCPFTLRHP